FVTVEHKTIRAVVSHLVSQLLAIVSQRAGPQILPASQPLLLVLLGLDLLLSVAVLATGHGVGAALLTVASSLGLGLLFCHLALGCSGHRPAAGAAFAGGTAAAVSPRQRAAGAGAGPGPAEGLRLAAGGGRRHLPPCAGPALAGGAVRLACLCDCYCWH